MEDWGLAFTTATLITVLACSVLSPVEIWFLPKILFPVSWFKYFCERIYCLLSLLFLLEDSFLKKETSFNPALNSGSHLLSLLAAILQLVLVWSRSFISTSYQTSASVISTGFISSRHPFKKNHKSSSNSLY